MFRCDPFTLLLCFLFSFCYFIYLAFYFVFCCLHCFSLCILLFLPFVYKCKDQCHRVETILRSINIVVPHRQIMVFWSENRAE